MVFSGRGDEGVHDFHAAAEGFATRHKFSASVSNCAVNAEKSFFKTQREFVLQPFAEARLCSACGYAVDSIANFCERDNAQEDSVFVHVCEPGYNAGIRARLHPFGDDVGIEQEAHITTLRTRPPIRSILIPEPLSGDAAKNSAKLPLRLVLRSHSSAATTTTAVRPLRVMVCGPWDFALSMTSLNLALASATVQARGAFWSPYGLDGHHSHLTGSRPDNDRGAFPTVRPCGFSFALSGLPHRLAAT